MRKSILVIGATFALAFAASAQAAELKIGVINGQQLVAQSPQAETLSKQLEEEFAPERRELLAQQNELKELQEKYQRDAEVMSESERASMEQRLRDLGRDFQYRQRTVGEDFQRRQREELARLQQQLQQAINEFAAAEGYDLILSEGVAFRGEALDVTDELLAYIKKQ
ncbi:MAG TPA: OmpH family outer membrane protein [Gammaproteobacteria bacterium]